MRSICRLVPVLRNGGKGGFFTDAKDREKEAEFGCPVTVIHEPVVRAVAAEMPPDETLCDLADFFKIFGDSTRVKILCALSGAEMCVCDIAALLKMTKSSISHQLRVLRQARLVKYRRAGKIVYYSLCDAHVTHIFREGLSHVTE